MDEQEMVFKNALLVYYTFESSHWVLTSRSLYQDQACEIGSKFKNQTGNGIKSA